MRSAAQFGALGGEAEAVALYALRVLPAAVLCPFLGGPVVPPLVRVAIAGGIGACAWLAQGGVPVDAPPLDVLIAAFRELCLGSGLGVIAAVPFEAARAGGRLVDTLRGATLAELHVAPIRQRESATGDLLVQWTIVLSATAGGDRLVVAALLESFRAVPVGTGVPGAALLRAGIHSAGELLGCALAVGAQAAAGVIAADLVLALASRSSPPLQIAASAQPARAGLGLAAVMVAASAIAGRLTAAVALSSSLLRDVARAVLP